MTGFRYKLYRFMQGRRGIDQFSRFLMIAALIMMLGAMFFGRLPVVYYILYYGDWSCLFTRISALFPGIFTRGRGRITGISR